MKKTLASLGKLDRQLWALTGAQLITSAGFSLALPFLSLYLHRDRGLAMTVVGTIMLFNAGVSAGGRVVGGELADRWGQRPVALLSAVLRTGLFGLLAFLIQKAGPIWAVALAYLGLRLTGAMAMTVITAMVADLAAGRRMEAYGVLRVGSNIGWAAGPAIGGYLAAFLPYWTLFAFGAAITGVAFLILLTVRGAGPKACSSAVGAGLRGLTQDRRFLVFLLLAYLVFVVAGQLVSTLSVYTVGRLGRSEAEFGALLTLNGLVIVFVQYPLARWADRLRRARALALGSLLYGIGYAAVGWARGLPELMAAVAVATLGEGLFAPTTMTVTAEMAGEERRGRYLGALGFAETLGWSTGPFVGGLLLDLLPHAPALMWGCLGTLAVGASLGFSRAGRSWGDGGGPPQPAPTPSRGSP